MKRFTTFLFTILGIIMMANAASFTAPTSDFVLIKGGSFTMGSPESEDWRSNDEAQHRVTLASFYMAKFEVTQKEWREITGKNSSNFSARVWWLFALAGLGFILAALFTHGIFSYILAILGTTCLWCIIELFHQEKRVEKGWFPKNPKRGKHKQ